MDDDIIVEPVAPAPQRATYVCPNEWCGATYTGELEAVQQLAAEHVAIHQQDPDPTLPAGVW